MHKNDIATGTVEGTGALITIQCGFQPRAVDLFNVDGDCMLFWTEDMGAGYGQKAVDSGAGATDISTISSNGVTKYAGTVAANSEGFTIGADSDLNVTSQTICWKAYR